MAVSSHHGHTPAAWTGVTITFIGFCASALFMVMGSLIGFIAGMVVVLAGPVVGAAMKAAGMGAAPRTQFQAKTQHEH